MVKDSQGRVLSKRLGNAISPVEMMEQHGVDALRVAMFFFAPTRDDILWNDQAVFGAGRFLNRVRDTVCGLAPRIRDTKGKIDADRLSEGGKELRRKCQEAIRRMTEGLGGELKLNTGIAAVMEFVNELRGTEPEAVAEEDLPAYAEAVRTLVLLLAPVAPHLAEELYREIGGEGTVFRAGWPEYDAAAARVEEVEIAVQVNKKVRGRITVPVGLSEADVLERARSEAGVVKYLEGKTLRKVVYVPGRLLSLVVG
jgi:leucyl-tRNA synthetase